MDPSTPAAYAPEHVVVGPLVGATDGGDVVGLTVGATTGEVVGESVTGSFAKVRYFPVPACLNCEVLSLLLR